jgi:hypothetical protein
MRFSFCADREAFINAFSKLGLPIKNESDLLTLEKWHNKGWDKDGKIKNKDGDFIIIDIKNFVNHSIKLRHNKVLNCRIKFVN